MLSTEQIEQLDRLSQIFRASFRAALPTLPHREEFTDRLIITVPAKHAETGELTIYLDEDEITVNIGTYFHCHFEAYIYDDLPAEDAKRKAVRSAIQYVTDFLADRIALRITFEDGQYAQSGTYYRDTIPKPAGAKDQEYVWSGPLKAA
ncbi:MAG TPA: hypothetical protein VF658_20475 [Pyrinomonadaceae bacterium]|jgi:hypothetical protein